MPFPGFIYWGLYAACGAVIVAYALWMRRANRQDGERPRTGTSATERDPS